MELNRSIENSISSFLEDEYEPRKSQTKLKNAQKNQDKSALKTANFLNILYSQAQLLEKLMKANQDFTEQSVMTQSVYSHSQASKSVKPEESRQS